MKCKQTKEKFPDFLIGDVDQTSKEKIQDHLSTCSSCREELESLSEVWTKLGVLPEEQPSNALRSRFYSMLEAYKQGLEEEKPASRLSQFFHNWLAHWWPRRPAFQFSFALALLVIGLFIGYFLNFASGSAQEVSDLRQEVHSMRQTVAVSLLEQQSPHQRLRGVSWSSQVERPDTKILETLLLTLNDDPNVNVRLAVLDALYLFHDYPMVRQGLIQSLSRQTSPLVQISLIDLITEMRERRAIEALKQLIQDEKINPDVRQRAEISIEQLS